VSTTTTEPLPAAFYARPTLRVARGLIGMVLVHESPEGRTAGIIVETEAYRGEDDPACHAAAGRTPRNAPLYGPPGRAYVYLNYGMHHLVNAVTEAEGLPAAVLIRALEPVEGLPLMRRRRARTGRVPADAELCRGPGNLTRAMGIDLRGNTHPLMHGALTIVDLGYRRGPQSSGPRVGIRRGLDRPWRYWVTGHPCVSGRQRP